MTQKTETPQRPGNIKIDLAAKRAAALRENLKRRKEQSAQREPRTEPPTEQK